MGEPQRRQVFGLPLLPALAGRARQAAQSWRTCSKLLYCRASPPPCQPCGFPVGACTPPTALPILLLSPSCVYAPVHTPAQPIVARVARFPTGCQPAPLSRRAGFRIALCEACSTFTARCSLLARSAARRAIRRDKWPARFPNGRGVGSPSLRRRRWSAKASRPAKSTGSTVPAPITKRPRRPSATRGLPPERPQSLTSVAFPLSDRRRGHAILKLACASST